MGLNGERGERAPKGGAFEAQVDPWRAGGLRASRVPGILARMAGMASHPRRVSRNLEGLAGGRANPRGAFHPNRACDSGARLRAHQRGTLQFL